MNIRAQKSELHGIQMSAKCYADMLQLVEANICVLQMVGGKTAKCISVA